MGKNEYRESLVDLLVATLASGRNTRRFKIILSERKLKRYREESISNALSRLRKKGYLNHNQSGWILTSKGTKRLKKRRLLSYMPSPFKRSQSANMIISFDIPEKDRKIRNWLRNQIKNFGYKMLQQSLWIGPGPLPVEFIKRLEDLSIRKNIKTFRINKKNL
ncbi:MAG: CRISPR-associated endonuclease Cas2 [bacterium]|nr:CRISPR-associated endonuclease Cas2 [bacterium]